MSPYGEEHLGNDVVSLHSDVAAVPYIFEHDFCDYSITLRPVRPTDGYSIDLLHGNRPPHSKAHVVHARVGESFGSRGFDLWIYRARQSILERLNPMDPHAFRIRLRKVPPSVSPLPQNAYQDPEVIELLSPMTRNLFMQWIGFASVLKVMVAGDSIEVRWVRDHQGVKPVGAYLSADMLLEVLPPSIQARLTPRQVEKDFPGQHYRGVVLNTVRRYLAGSLRTECFAEDLFSEPAGRCPDT